jgi:hypothetical protein
MDARDFIIMILTAIITLAIILILCHGKQDEKRFATVQRALDEIKQRLNIAPLVLVSVLGVTFFLYWQHETSKQQAQRERIIVLETMLQAEREKNTDQDSKIDQARNYATRAESDVAELKGKFDQFANTYTVNKAVKNNGKLQ